VRNSILNVRGVEDLRIDEHLAIVQVSDADVTPVVVREVVSAGGQVYAVRTREHGLEDVYFALEHEEVDAGQEGSVNA